MTHIVSWKWNMKCAIKAFKSLTENTSLLALMDLVHPLDH